jgi:hypothetical protein
MHWDWWWSEERGRRLLRSRDLGTEVAYHVRQLTQVVLRQSRDLLLVGRLLPCLLGRLVGLQLFEPGLQYYTRMVDGM